MRVWQVIDQTRGRVFHQDIMTACEFFCVSFLSVKGRWEILNAHYASFKSSYACWAKIHIWWICHIWCSNRSKVTTLSSTYINSHTFLPTHLKLINNSRGKHKGNQHRDGVWICDETHIKPTFISIFSLNTDLFEMLDEALGRVFHQDIETPRSC